MPYILPYAKTAVFFSPKSGGTSLRAYFFHLENGFAFREYTVQGKKIDANELVKNTRWKAFDQSCVEGFERLAVIRDPVRRFLSGYSNRVGHYRELGNEKAGKKLQELGLPPDPPIEDFVANFDRYRQVSWQLRRHFWPQQTFLGNDPTYYSQIFALEKIEGLVIYLNKKLETNAVLPRLQTGGPKIQFPDLPVATQQAVLEIVNDDVAFEFRPEYRHRYAY